MNKNQSSRHHYIPKFLIKNFTDDEGFLYVYDKQKDKILDSRQSPKSIFFERNRNTVDFSGHPLDNLEQLYSEMDNAIAKDITNVLKSKTATPEELASIVILANQLKWRVPKVDDHFNMLKEDLSQKDLSIRIKIKDDSLNIDNEAIEHIEQSDIFKEAKRAILSVLPFSLNPEHLMEIYNKSFIYTHFNSSFPALIGDCPIIEKQHNDIYKMEDFIFSLSSYDTLIYKKDISKKMINSDLFFFQKDITTIHNAVKFIACSKKEHLEKVVRLYHEIKNNNRLENLTNESLFQYIS